MLHLAASLLLLAVFAGAPVVALVCAYVCAPAAAAAASASTTPVEAAVHADCHGAGTLDGVRAAAGADSLCRTDADVPPSVTTERRETGVTVTPVALASAITPPPAGALSRGRPAGTAPPRPASAPLSLRI